MSTIKANTITSVDGLSSIDMASLMKRLPTAWVNFDGTSVDGNNHCVITDSYNIDYVLRASTGLFQVHFLVDMDNGNYCTSMTATITAGGNSSSGTYINNTISYVEVSTKDDGAFTNILKNSVIVYGGKD